MGERTCSIEGCDRLAPSNRKGWCGPHYSRWITKGDPRAVMIRNPDRTPEERFWSKVDAGDCWQWTDSLVTGGYGVFRVGTRSVGAHRWAWEHLVGPIPSGLQLDHLCRNHGCVNPDHLEPVTQLENGRRGAVGARLRLRTHCNHGHEFTPENTAFYKANGSRSCRTCARTASRANYYKRKERTNAVPPLVL